MSHLIPPSLATFTEVITLIDKPTGTGQIYPRKILTTAFDIYMSKDVSFRYGTVDAPVNDAAGHTKNVSHYLMDYWCDDDTLKGEIQIVDTHMGNILLQQIAYGVDITLGLAAMATFKPERNQSRNLFETYDENEEYSKIVDDMAVVMVYATTKANTNH